MIFDTDSDSEADWGKCEGGNRLFFIFRVFRAFRGSNSPLSLRVLRGENSFKPEYIIQLTAWISKNSKNPPEGV